MTPRYLRTLAAFVIPAALLATSALSQARPAVPQSPYGGVTVEDIVARVNDQIITQSDYDRARKELDDEAKQHGATMQQISEAHQDLLRDLIDRQLWLSKGKELGINGETELIKRLDEIRKQYNLPTREDLEKAAKEQGVSFEDFKANIRNQIITQSVMREEVGRRIQFTQGELERYFEVHKQDYAKPESVELSEILVSTGADPDDAAKVAAGKAKADDLWWPFDSTHPNDAGYALYAEAMWNGFRQAVDEKRVCHAPERMIHPDAFTHLVRQKVSALAALPEDWDVGIPTPWGVAFDFYMSRWFDDVVIAKHGAGPLRVVFDGSFVQLFGEATEKSGKVRILVDDHPAKGEGITDGILDAKGNGMHFVRVVAENLDASHPHTLDITPLLEKDQEFRLESICVAGGAATVAIAS